MRSRTSSAASAVLLLVLAACAQTGAPGGAAVAGPDYGGACVLLQSQPGQLVFQPPSGTPGPGFRIQALRGAGDYDVQVNAVDAAGRYGPDARGTVHLDAGQRSGTLTTPDLALPTGQSVRFAGRWHCVSASTQAPPSERPGGPASPR